MSPSSLALQPGAADHDPVKSSLSILLGASVWGIAWFPYRVLAGWGLGGLRAAALVSLIAAAIAMLAFRRHLGGLRQSWLFVAIGAAAGITNAGFVWGSVNGHVMRVLLLFYLTPVWTALFARLWLGERLSATGFGPGGAGAGRRGLMLWSPQAGAARPPTWRNGPGWWRAWALPSTMCCRVTPGSACPIDGRVRTVAVFLGSVAVSAPCALWLEPALAGLAAGREGAVLLLAVALAGTLVWQRHRAVRVAAAAGQPCRC